MHICIVMGEMRSKTIRAVQEFNAWGHRRHFLNPQPPIIPNFHKILRKMQQNTQLFNLSASHFLTKKINF